MALLLAFAIALTTTPASASPVSDKQQQARAVRSQITVLDDKLEVAAEDYNDARIRHAKLVKKVSKTRAQLRVVRARMGVLQTSLGTRAETMYRNGPLGMLEVLLGASTFDDFATTWDLLSRMNRDEAATVAELKSARRKAKEAEKVLVAAEGKAQVEVDLMSARKRERDRQLAARKALLRGIESEIAALEAADRAREAAATRRARQRIKAATYFSPSFGPPSRSPRSGVVSVAMRYLGAPYSWGADGPNSFDCSGFTMYVYRQVGVSLPHSSRAQIGSGERVSRGDLRPGDLVFFGSPIHHVGIYVGGNAYVHAPSTGDVVKISTMTRRDYAGACRP